MGKIAPDQLKNRSKPKINNNEKNLWREAEVRKKKPMNDPEAIKIHHSLSRIGPMDDLTIQ